jgi:hypothetical protein
MVSPVNGQIERNHVAAERLSRPVIALVRVASAVRIDQPHRTLDDRSPEGPVR